MRGAGQRQDKDAQVRQARVRQWLPAIVMALAFMCQWPAVSGAQDLTALARLDPAGSVLTDKGQGLAIDLRISQPVPYRVSLMDGPPRLVVDFREVDFTGLSPERLGRAERVRDVAWGAFAPGWSRMVIETDIPLRVKSADLHRHPDGSATIGLRFLPTTPADFAARIADQGGGAAAAGWALPETPRADPVTERQKGERPLRVVLDPGHGGIDPGAEVDGQTEAALMLSFSRELAELLRRAGMEVTLTREGDRFVPLEARISIARAARADLLLSLHADALAEGDAKGATIYLMDEKASDAAAARIAERHERGDLLAGVDLSGNDDEVALVLMDMAQTETRPRGERLARILADTVKANDIRMHRRPIQAADFAVLKAADIPSLLLEVGFLSSKADAENLADPVWRARLQQSILTALQAWAIADAAEAGLIRQ